MLLNHPNEDSIFAAGDFIDTILAVARRMTTLPPQAYKELLFEADNAFNGLRKLNQESFEASVVISDSIRDMEERLSRLAQLPENEGYAPEGQNCKHLFFDEVIIPAIARLESLDTGFGTCMI